MFSSSSQNIDPRALRSTKKETLGSRRGFLLIWEVFRDRVLRVFHSFGDISARSQAMFLMIPESRSGRLGFNNQALGTRDLKKRKSSPILVIVDFGLICLLCF